MRASFRALGMCTVTSFAAFGMLVAEPTVASAQQVEARDVVRLKNGALYSGTISEMVPGATVEIVLVTGGTRRFDMSEVAYAGPAAQAPAPPPTSVPPTQPMPPPSQGAPVSFRSAQEGLTLHEVTGSAYGLVAGGNVTGYAELHAYRSLCSAPCETSVAPGSHEFAVSQGDGKPVISSGQVVVPPGPTVLQGSYESRAGIRIAGLLVLLGSAAAGFGLAYSSFSSSHPGDMDMTAFWAGTAIATAGSLVGVIMMFQKDQAKVELVPAASAKLPGPWLSGGLGREGAALPHASAPGASVRVTF